MALLPTRPSTVSLRYRLSEEEPLLVFRSISFHSSQVCRLIFPQPDYHVKNPRARRSPPPGLFRSLKRTSRGQAICRRPCGVIPEQARFVSAKRLEPCRAIHGGYRSRLVVGNPSACVSVTLAKCEFVASMRPCYQKLQWIVVSVLRLFRR